MRKRPDDATLRRAITTSRSFEEAATRLGLGKTTVRKHAARLGVRTRFRFGCEMLPSDTALKRMLREAEKGKGLHPLARRLGVTKNLLMEKADELGVSGRFVVRAAATRSTTTRSATRPSASVCRLRTVEAGEPAPTTCTSDNPLHSIDRALHSMNARFILKNA